MAGSLLVPAAPALAQEVERPDPACVDGWSSQPLPRAARRSQPHEIVTDGGAPAWLVGGDDGVPLVLRWYGDGWRRVEATPAGLPASEPAALLDATLGQDGSLLAVGNTRPVRRVLQPLAGAMGTEGWQERPVGQVPGANVSLAGVARKGRAGAWAVGSWLDGGRMRAYALRWDGARWLRQDPARGAGESGLTAVSGTPGGHVWAVGWSDGASGVKRPLVLRVRGRGWREVPVPTVPPGIGVLTDVEFPSRREGWAVGYLVPPGSSAHEPFLLRWDGRAWTHHPIPSETAVSLLPRSLAVAEDGGIWIAGTQLRPERVDPQGFVAHASEPGGPWSVDLGMLPGDERSEIFSVAATTDGALIAGVAGDRAIVMRSCEEVGPEVGSEEEAAADPEAASGGPGSAASAVWPAAAAEAPRRVAVQPSEGAFTFLASERRLPRPVEPEGFRIRDVSRSTGLRVSALMQAGLAADLDGDAREDLLFWSHADGDHFYLAREGGFEEGPARAFGHVDRHGCSAADIDADGTLDVFCSTGRGRGTAIDRHELSTAPGLDEGGVVPDLAGIEDPLGRGRAATFIELDGDGFPDLFVSNTPDRGDALPGTNRFYRNVGGRFVAAPEVGLDTSVGGWCAMAADVDGDGDDDLLVCQEYSDDGRDAGLRVQRNDDGRLRERSRRMGIRPIDDIDVAVADMTRDGRADIVQLSRSRLRISEGTPEGRFRPIYEVRTPFATGLAVGDVDGDGATDVYVVAGSQRGNERDLLLVNDGRGRSFTSVRIPQTRRGSGADVIAIDHDDNGLTDFVVLNGRGLIEGPVRLLASFRRP